MAKVEVSAAVTLSGDRSLLHRGSNTIQIGCKNRPSSWLSGEDTLITCTFQNPIFDLELTTEGNPIQLTNQHVVLIPRRLAIACVPFYLDNAHAHSPLTHTRQSYPFTKTFPQCTIYSSNSSSSPSSSSHTPLSPTDPQAKTPSSSRASGHSLSAETVSPPPDEYLQSRS